MLVEVNHVTCQESVDKYLDKVQQGCSWTPLLETAHFSPMDPPLSCAVRGQRVSTKAVANLAAQPGGPAVSGGFQLSDFPAAAPFWR